MQEECLDKCFSVYLGLKANQVFFLQRSAISLMIFL